MKNFVGVFDSGIGGLTVLAELQKVAPQCDYLYFADHAFCPYGTKKPSEIRRRALAVGMFLARLGASALVVACNTASVFATDIRNCVCDCHSFGIAEDQKITTKEHFLSTTALKAAGCNKTMEVAQAAVRLPVFDVISSTVAEVAHSGVKKVALLATNATVESGIYQQKLRVFGIEVENYPCSEFVPLAENGASSAEKTQAVMRCMKNFSRNVDAVVLACTHFPLLQNEIVNFVGDNIPIISCSETLSRCFSNAKLPRGGGKTKFFTSGDVARANQSATFFGAQFEHADVWTE